LGSAPNPEPFFFFVFSFDLEEVVVSGGNPLPVLQS